MASALYTRDILRLAASLIPNDRLEHPDGVAEARAPLCGSRVVAEVAFAPDRTISALALRVSACALGQASASILRVNALGNDMTMISQMHDAVREMLQTGTLPDLWPDVHVLAPAKDYPSRHAAVLLPYEALSAAVASVGLKS